MDLHSHNTFSIYLIQQLLSYILLIFYKFHVFHNIFFLEIHTHKLFQLFVYFTFLRKYKEQKRLIF